MWLHMLLLLLGSCPTDSLRLPATVPVSTGPQRYSSAARPLQAGIDGRVPDGKRKSDKAQGGVVRPAAVNLPIQMRRNDTNSPAQNVPTMSEAVVATLVNTGPANILLTPLHRWVSSRRRVAQAVEEAAIEKKRSSAAAAEREEELQRALVEEQEKQELRSNPWRAFLRDTVPVPQPVRNVYGALIYAINTPARLTESGKQTAESLAAAAESLAVAAETVAEAPDRVRETMAKTQETVKTARDILAATSGRVQEVATATQKLPGRVHRALGEGTEAVESVLEESQRLVQAGRQVSEAAGALPSRLPDLIETATEDAMSLATDLAEGTATELNAAGTALWGVTKEAGVWAIERVLRGALAPVHQYRTSSMRVQAAVDEERLALEPNHPWSRSSNVTESNSSMTPGAVPSLTGNKSDAEDVKPDAGPKAGGTGPDEGDSTQVSRFNGVRGRFSSWRRRRRSIVTVAIPDEVDDEVDGTDDDERTNRSGASPSSETTAVSQEGGGDVSAAATKTVSKTAMGLQDTTVKERGEVAMAASLTPVSAAGSVAVIDNKLLADGEQLFNVGAQASSIGTDSLDLLEPQASVSAAVKSPELARSPAVESVSTAVAWRFPATPGFDEDGVDSDATSSLKNPVTMNPARALADDPNSDERATALVDNTVSSASVVEGVEGKGQARSKDLFQSSTVEPGVPTLVRLNKDAPSGNEQLVLSAASPSRGRPKMTATAAQEQEQLSPELAPTTNSAASNTSRAALESEAIVAYVIPVEIASAGAGLATPTASTATAVAGQPGQDLGSGSLSSPTRPSSPVLTTSAPLASPRVPPPSRTEREDKACSILAGQDGQPKVGTKTGSRQEKAVAMESTVVDTYLTAIPSQASNDESVATAAAAVVAAGGPSVMEPVQEERRQASVKDAGERLDRKDSRGTPGATNPAAEFLKEWVDKAVPQKKAELKGLGTKGPLCLERQWYPVAIAPGLPQELQGVVDGEECINFQMLGREYELRAAPTGASVEQTKSPEENAWICHAVHSEGSSREESQGSFREITGTAEIPVRESSGLLWAWPDSSPDGRAAASRTNPALIPEFSAVGYNQGGREPWRRLFWRHTALQRRVAARSHVGGDSRGKRRRRGWEREQTGNRLNGIVVAEREVCCGFSEAVGGLLSASHGQAVRVAVADGRGSEGALEERDLVMVASPANAIGSGSELFQATFNTCGVAGQVLFSSPTVVEWRFSPPTRSRTAVAGREKSTGEASLGGAERNRPTINLSHVSAPAAHQQVAASAGESETAESPRQGWLRRRLRGVGGRSAGPNRTGVVVSAVGEHRSSREASHGSEEDNHRGVRLPAEAESVVRYVAVVLPVSPDRTKIYARLEVEPFGVLTGQPLRFPRRRVLGRIVEAIDSIASAATAGAHAKTPHRGAAASGGVTSGGGKEGNLLLSSAVGAWLPKTAKSGPFGGKPPGLG